MIMWVVGVTMRCTQIMINRCKNGERLISHTVSSPSQSFRAPHERLKGGR